MIMCKMEQAQGCVQRHKCEKTALLQREREKKEIAVTSTQL